MGATLVWAKLPPAEIHAYRVACKRCERFVGWGTEPQHQQLLYARESIETVQARVEPPPATLKDLF
jgi:hypothetical protein